MFVGGLPVFEQLLGDFARPPAEIRVLLALTREGAVNLLEPRPVSRTLVAHVARVRPATAAAALRGLVDAGYLVASTLPDGRRGLRLPLSRKREPERPPRRRRPSIPARGAA